MLNILIADDHFLVRKGLRQLLEENLPLAALEEAEDGVQAMEKARGRHFDLIILDYSMPGKEGLDLVRDLKDLDPSTHILILSILPEEQYALRAFKLGASGCVNKAIDPGELVAAVKTVVAGHRYLSPKAGELLLEVGDFVVGAQPVDLPRQDAGEDEPREQRPAHELRLQEGTGGLRPLSGLVGLCPTRQSGIFLHTPGMDDPRMPYTGGKP